VKTLCGCREKRVNLTRNKDQQQAAQRVYSIPCDVTEVTLAKQADVQRFREHTHIIKEGLLDKSKLAQHASEKGKWVGLDELGFWELKVTANSISTFLSSGSPLSRMRLATPRDQHNVTNSSRVYKRFQSRAFSFYSIDAHSGKHKMVSHTLHLILCTSFHGRDSLARFVA
jgi:hypothetical protein